MEWFSSKQYNKNVLYLSVCVQLSNHVASVMEDVSISVYSSPLLPSAAAVEPTTCLLTMESTANVSVPILWSFYTTMHPTALTY